MNIYNNDGKSSHRRASSCSYCRAKGHNATNCPRVAEDYAYFSQNPPIIPLGISKSTNTCHWFKNPKYWGEWYQKCLDTHAKQEAAKKKAKSSPTGSTRSAPKCGFCGSKDHNRRHCETMQQYNRDAIEANRNWRRAFYRRFVEELGISEGALLNLRNRNTYSNQEGKEFIGVVTSVNWGELSLFSSSKDSTNRYCYRDDAYIQHLNVEVQVGNETHCIRFEDGLDVVYGGAKRNLVKFSGGRYSWRYPEFVSVLSPSETPIGEEWIEEGHAEAMKFLTKKRSMAKLDEADVTALIKHWR